MSNPSKYVNDFNDIITEINNTWSTEAKRQNIFSLKNLKVADLTVTSNIVDKQKLIEIISSFEGGEAWFLYDDQLDLSDASCYLESKNLLEAEISNVIETDSNSKVVRCKSVKIKHITQELYSVVEYSNEKSSKNGTYAYYDQNVVIRQDKQEQYDSVQYRLWFKYNDSETRWESAGQQFIAFKSKGE